MPAQLDGGDDGRPHPEIATLLRQKPAAAEGRMAKSSPTLDALRDRMEALRRDQNALRELPRIKSRLRIGRRSPCDDLGTSWADLAAFS
jgi:hypothetical protein